MLPTIQVGPVSLPTGPILVLISFMLALEVSQRAATRLGLDGDSVYNMGYLAAVACLLGARLGYVVQYWPVFRHDPAAMFALTADGLSLLPGIGAGLIACYMYARRKGIANRRLLDALAPGLALLSIGIALGNLASGDGYGSPTALPWAVQQWQENRHPVLVYHLLAALAIGVVVVRTPQLFDGLRFGVFVALDAAGRLFLEAFHGDSATLSGFRTVQIVSLAVLLGALLVLRRWATAYARLAAAPTAPERLRSA
jgi:prolipoprotein diacylglyceryltransferase